MKNLNISISKILLSIYFSLPAFIITLCLHFNPSNTPPPSPFESLWQPLVISILLFALFFSTYFIILSIKRRLVFSIIFSLSFVVFLTLIIILGLGIHRDFYTISFQILIIYYIIFIINIDFFRCSFEKKRFIRYIYYLLNF